jgi:predicted lipoprotein with Yx(FWY)xxD motif
VKPNFRSTTTRGRLQPRILGRHLQRSRLTRTRLSLPIVAVIAAAAIVAIVATTGSSAKKTPAVAPNSAISVQQTSLGKTLTDANGCALYLFAADKPNASALSAAGRAFWPSCTAANKPSATGGAVGGDIGTVTSANGAAQVSYNGHPLYYFIGDHNPGQTTGQALNQFGARWYVLAPAGAAITAAPRAGSSSSSTAGGATYGY